MQKFICQKFIHILALIAGCALLSNCSSPEKQTTEIVQEKTKQESAIKVVPVKLLQLHEELELPGQLEAFQNVPIHAKVEGFISAIYVDRGSTVKKGQVMITVSCPELDEKTKEAAAKVSAAEASYSQSQSTLQSQISKEVETKAKLDADELTYSRLTEAAKTPGAIAQNEVDISNKTVAGDRARLQSVQAEVAAAKSLVISEKNNVIAANNVLNSLSAMSSYLNIKAPFDGVVTERNVHEGSIVAVDASRNAPPLIRVQQTEHLRLVVAVPEDCVSGLSKGDSIPFSVPAFLGKTFNGTIARLGYALDEKTRTMPVELDVANKNGQLEPGMFATVKWMVTRAYKTFFVPSAAVARDLKGEFVIKIVNGIVERISVKQGHPMNGLVEVVGNLREGDLVALKASNEIKNGTHVETVQASEKDIEQNAEKSSAAGE